MFVNNKKGLSDVITTVLIILLVLAAVVLIWTFIRGQLDTSTQQINNNVECLNIQLTPVSCTTTTGAVSYTHNAGSKLFKEVSVIATQNDNTIKSGSAVTVPASGLSGTATLSPDSGKTIASVKLVPILDLGAEGKYNCAPTADIVCQAPAPVTP